MPFDSSFIPGFLTPLPELGARALEVAFDDAEPVDHSRFTIVFNEQRGFALYTAHNIDGVTLIPEGRIPREDSFRLDPAVPSDLQVDNDRGYVHNPWDRGHLVRRRAMHWGDRAGAELADSESFFWTNIAPQHHSLHQKAWGSIEDWMLDLADEAERRASVFTGPVFTPEDPEITNRPGEDPIRIPAGFWKIVAIKSANQPRAAGFLVWQRDFDGEIPVEFDPILEQVRITTIEYLTGLSFGNLRQLDPLRFGSAAEAAALAPQPEAAEAGAVAPPLAARPSAIVSPENIFMPTASTGGG